ncbi:MAG: hypothetical protein ACI9KN_001334 [Gammaproteobacteria bacterium]|jgi:hypothetical protein
MTVRTRRNQAQWQHLVERPVSSDLNAAAFCRQQGLCRKPFYHHRKMLIENTTRLATSRFIQVQAKPAAAPTSTIVVLDYRQARLQFPAGIGPVWVADLMKALS